MLNSLIQCSALELASFGIRVNAVAPTICQTNFRKNLTKEENKEYLQSMGEIHILKSETLKPGNVANAIIYLASDDASFTTGEILTIDNGFSLNHDLCFSQE